MIPARRCVPGFSRRGHRADGRRYQPPPAGTALYIRVISAGTGADVPVFLPGRRWRRAGIEGCLRVGQGGRRHRIGVPSVCPPVTVVIVRIRRQRRCRQVARAIRCVSASRHELRRTGDDGEDHINGSCVHELFHQWRATLTRSNVPQPCCVYGSTALVRSGLQIDARAYDSHVMHARTGNICRLCYGYWRRKEHPQSPSGICKDRFCRNGRDPQAQGRGGNCISRGIQSTK